MALSFRFTFTNIYICINLPDCAQSRRSKLLPTVYSKGKYYNLRVGGEGGAYSFVVYKVIHQYFSF